MTTTIPCRTVGEWALRSRTTHPSPFVDVPVGVAVGMSVKV